MKNFPLSYPDPSTFKWTDEHEETFRNVSYRFGYSSPYIYMTGRRKQMEEFGRFVFFCNGEGRYPFRRKPYKVYPYQGTRDFLYLMLCEEKLLPFIRGLHYYNDETLFTYAVAKLMNYKDSYIFSEFIK